MAGACGAGHPAHAGDEARRRRRAGHGVRGWPATSSSTTARGAGTASRSRRATASAIDDIVTNFGDGPVRDSAGRRRRGARARTTSTRSTRRGCWRRTSSGMRFVSRLRPERPGRRLAVLRGQARTGSSGSAAGCDETPSAAASRSSSAGTTTWPRPTRTSGTRGGARRDARVGARAGGVRGRCATGGWRTPTALARRAAAGSRWWDYRAGMFHKNFGMRIDLLLVAPAGGGARRRRRDRPRGAQGPAGPVRSRAARHRPRRARQAVRRRTGRGRSPGSRRGRARVATRSRADPVRGGAEDPVGVARGARPGARRRPPPGCYILRLTARSRVACRPWGPLVTRRVPDGRPKRRSFVRRNTSSTKSVCGGRNDADFRGLGL